MGLIDDFSYVKTAFVFAQTGHFVYNGWATAMLGAQIVWAAPFIKLLGYSFFATRVSNVVLAILCVWLTHAVFRRAGLNRAHAILGALTLGLSPLFVPLCATFMTDISGLLGIVAAIYCCLRALESTSSGAAIFWLVLGNIAGLLGGTTRQISWLAVLVLMPSAAWLLRKRRGVPTVAIVLWLLGAVFIAASMWWFKHQPFYVPEPLIKGHVGLRSLRELAGSLAAAGLCLAFLILPALATALPGIRRLRVKAIGVLIAASLVLMWIGRFLAYHHAEKGLFPWTGDIVDNLGTFSTTNAWFLGLSPSTFNAPDRAVVSVIVVFLAVTFAYAVYRSSEGTGSRVSGAGPTWFTLAQLLVPFTLAYIVLLFPRGIWDTIIDRYLLPLMVITLIALLRFHQERISSRLPMLSWVALIALTALSILGTHDWIASHKARLEAVHRLQAAGVPLTKIEAGYEFDGITQIDHDGVVYDPRVTYPPGMNIHAYLPPGISPDCEYLYQPHTPVLRPQFFLSHQQVACLAPSEFGDVPYRAWMPPFHRSIAILVRK